MICRPFPSLVNFGFGHFADPQAPAASDSTQPEAVSISARGTGPRSQVAGHAAPDDTSGQGAHQAPDSVLRVRWT